MEAILGQFRQAVADGHGYVLAEALTPIAPPEDAGRLYEFYRSNNAFSIQDALRNEIVYKSQIRLPKAESNAWIEVFACYWKAVGEILAADEAMNQGKQADWKKAYDTWKEVANALIRGYNTNAFDAWTIPCLYTVGKYLRVFALKADEVEDRSDRSVSLSKTFSEDIVSTIGNQENLQDAARQINRIFALCVSDRYLPRIGQITTLV